MEKTIITKILFHAGYFFFKALVKRKDNKFSPQTMKTLEWIYRDIIEG